jgi:hypothetical protein
MLRKDDSLKTPAQAFSAVGSTKLNREKELVADSANTLRRQLAVAK